MKLNSYTLHVDKACQENWKKMLPSAQGKFCERCAKNVMDLQHLNDQELIKFMKNNENICGKFSASQLNRPIEIYEPSIPFFPRLKAITSFFLFSSLSALAQPASNGLHAKAISFKSSVNSEEQSRLPFEDSLNGAPPVYQICGQVLDELNEPLIGVAVHISGTNTGVTTNVDGLYTLEIPPSHLEGNISVTFHYLGYLEELVCLTEKDLPLKKDIKLTVDPKYKEEAIILGHPSYHKRSRFIAIKRFFENLFYY